MLKIRLSRTGKKNQPHYRIVVTEKRSKRDGSTVDELGFYIPYKNPAQLKLDVDAYDKWTQKGAQSSDVVKYLRSKAKDNQIVEIVKKAKTKKKKSQEEASTAAGA